MVFDKNTLDSIREDLNKVLKSYGVQNNIDFKIGKITYSENNFRTTLEAFNIEGGGDADQIAFEQNCHRFGVPSEWFGKTIEVNGQKYMIGGINTRARKYPISLKSVQTGTMDKKCSVSMIKTQLSR